MTSEDPAKLSKQQRRERRRQAALRRRVLRRLGRAGVVAAVIAVPALLVLEFTGDQEMAEAEVTKTRLWRHYPGDGTSHQHSAATLTIEGLSETTLDRADGYERSQRVTVWVRRGRITGWPYFQDIAKPGEIQRQGREQDSDEEAISE